MCGNEMDTHTHTLLDVTLEIEMEIAARLVAKRREFCVAEEFVWDLEDLEDAVLAGRSSSEEAQYAPL